MIVAEGWDDDRTPDGHDPSLAELLRTGDLDGLVRAVNRLSAAEAWDELLVLRARCHAAAEELGKQLWGPAQYAEYRLALHAPSRVAAQVVTPGAARFALGPLTEVLAQGHAFGEVAQHLDGVVAGVVAQERVLRGEDLRDDARARPEDATAPLRLQPWEPAYALPTYRADERLDGSPTVEPGPPLPVDAPPGRPNGDTRVTGALLDLVAPWVSASEGEAHVVSVAGDAASAVASLVPGEAALRALTATDAMAAMAWAASSGGALGRRRGGAAGRAAAWWVAHVASGLAFPADPDELEFHLEDLRWYLVETALPSLGRVTEAAGDEDRPEASTTGWHLHLAVEDPAGGWAAAIDAHDVPVGAGAPAEGGLAPA